MVRLRPDPDPTLFGRAGIERVIFSEICPASQKSPSEQGASLHQHEVMQQCCGDAQSCTATPLVLGCSGDAMQEKVEQ